MTHDVASGPHRSPATGRWTRGRGLLGPARLGGGTHDHDEAGRRTRRGRTRTGPTQGPRPTAPRCSPARHGRGPGPRCARVDGAGRPLPHRRRAIRMVTSSAPMTRATSARGPCGPVSSAQVFGDSTPRQARCRGRGRPVPRFGTEPWGAVLPWPIGRLREPVAAEAGCPVVAGGPRAISSPCCVGGGCHVRPHTVSQPSPPSRPPHAPLPGRRATACRTSRTSRTGPSGRGRFGLRPRDGRPLPRPTAVREAEGASGGRLPGRVLQGTATAARPTQPVRSGPRCDRRPTRPAGLQAVGRAAAADSVVLRLRTASAEGSGCDEPDRRRGDDP